METKSRYEVISDLEAQKRTLLSQKESFAEQIRAKEKNIKNHCRVLEDLEEELEAFKDEVPKKQELIQAMIESVEGSLERMSAVSQSPRK